MEVIAFNTLFNYELNGNFWENIDFFHFFYILKVLEIIENIAKLPVIICKVKGRLWRQEGYINKELPIKERACHPAISIF